MKNWIILLFSTLNILLYLVVIGMWISIPQQVMLNLFTTITSMAITCGLILTNREKFKDFYTSHYFKKLTSSLISVFLIFCILGFINYLGYKNVVMWDFSKNQINSLTKQSTALLKNMNGQVEFTIFSQKRDYETILALVELYREQNNSIKINFVDAELSPAKVRKEGITKIPAVVISKAQRSQVVTRLDELSLTNALIKVTRVNDPTIFFTTGHGEINLKSTENEGGQAIARILTKSSHQIKTLNTKLVKKIPAETNLLIIWGAKEGFFAEELAMIEDYLNEGGKFMLALDPDFNSEGLVKLKALMEKYGLVMNNDLVVDRLSHANGSSGTVPIIHRYSKSHEITKDFKKQVFLPLASSLIVNDKERWTEVGLSNQFPAAWGETSRDEIASMKLTYNEGDDHKGPLTYFATYENEQQRMAVFGNSTFIINTYEKFPQNMNLFVNTLNWVVGEDRLISFNNPVIEDRPLFMSQNQLGVIFYFSVIFCPLLLLGLAFFLYKRRQNL